MATETANDNIIHNTDSNQDLTFRPQISRESSKNSSESQRLKNKMEIPKLGGDSEEGFNKFLRTNNNDYTVAEMKKFLKQGITKSGLRIMTTNDSEWYYDYYQATKSSSPPITELTEGTTIDYYYHSTPFETQIGNINLVMMYSQVNFPDGTFTPADRSFKANAITPEMIERAREGTKKYAK